jgi:hypothetical protein
MIFRRADKRGRWRFPDMLVLALAAFLFLFFVVIPNIGYRSGRSPRIYCISNLKQLSLGFVLWARDNEKPFPMELPVAKGGTRELASAGNLLTNYSILHQELPDLKILACPSDKKRKAAKSIDVGALTINNLSYFLNIQASVTNEDQVLVGDRSITLNGISLRGLSGHTSADAFGWTNWLHQGGGNIALTDGSALLVDDRHLRKQLEKSERGTIRLLAP